MSKTRPESEQFIKNATEAVRKALPARVTQEQLQFIEGAIRQGLDFFTLRAALADRDARITRWQRAYATECEKTEALFEQIAASEARAEKIRHASNEWADMATNGLQWLRNLKEGICSVDEALANIEDNLTHCRAVNDAALSQPSKPAAPSEEMRRVPMLGINNGVMLEPDDMHSLMMTAGIGDGFDKDDAAAVVLWVGETIDINDGVETRTYGLNAYNVEVPEEGSICIRELPAAPLPASDEGGEK